jgi:hypothetical protein
MRGLAAFLGGALTVLTANFLVPAMGLDVAKVHRTEPLRDLSSELTTQHVDRTHKGDRLDIKQSVILRRATPPSKPLHGCEPDVSPLAAAAKNSIRRCIT